MYVYGPYMNIYILTTQASAATKHKKHTEIHLVIDVIATHKAK